MLIQGQCAAGGEDGPEGGAFALNVLEHFRNDEEAGLAQAVTEGNIHEHWYTLVPLPEAVGAETQRRLALQAAGSMLPFAVRQQPGGRLVGMTTYMNVDSANRRVEIGSTWYGTSVQRTGLNTECKLMLLRHAFEVLGCIAVEFRTHWFNHQIGRAHV